MNDAQSFFSRISRAEFGVHPYVSRLSPFSGEKSAFLVKDFIFSWRTHPGRVANLEGIQGNPLNPISIVRVIDADYEPVTIVAGIGLIFDNTGRGREFI